MISMSNLTSGTLANNTGTTTSSVNVGAGQLIFVWIGGDWSTPPSSIIVSGLGLTWTQYLSFGQPVQNKNQLWYAFAPSAVSGQITISFTGASGVNGWGYIVDAAKYTTSSNFLVQNNTNNAGATDTGINTSLSAFSSAFNGTYALVYKAAPVSFSPSAGFSMVANVAGSGIAVGSAFASDNRTSISFSWSSNPGDDAIAAVELKAQPQGGLFFAGI